MTVGEYIELVQVLDDDTLGHTRKMIEAISVAEDLDPETLMDLSAIDLGRRFKAAADSRHTACLQKVKPVELAGLGTLWPKDFDALCLGEYIDLEQYIVNHEVHRACSVLFVRCEERPFCKTVWEDYSEVDVEKRSDVIIEMDSEGLVSRVAQYCEFRNGLVSTYGSLFGSDKTEEEAEVDEDELTESELKMRDAEKLHGQFAWESLVLFLAEGDVTKFEAVCRLPLVFAFNMASYKSSTRTK